MLTPTAKFAVDPDQTVPMRAVLFVSKLFATKTSYVQTNIANPVQATPEAPQGGGGGMCSLDPGK